MAETTAREKRDLVLSENEYAYMQDVTKGSVKTYAGPCVVTPSGQEVPIQYDPKTHSFIQVEAMDGAKRKSLVIPEGFYCVLTNPSKNRLAPEKGKPSPSPELEIGKKVIIPGNTDFSLWPGQEADLIRGHHLRSNQYLLVKVYNEDEARKNWATAIVKPATTQIVTEGKTTEEIEKAKKDAADKAKQQAKAEPPKDLTMGKQLIIKGTDVSFYIPPTGVTVVAEGVDQTGKPNFVREALTLERLEYSILIDEDGNKRYANGPTVVFPKPTERFMEGKNDDGQASRKFRAIELNELQGIHIKVIADYKDGTTEHKAGQELFITGKETAIYYPREEHAAIKYDGKVKHFATAIPKGEARYVLQRMTGEIKTVRGPTMLLPDPRTEVIVRRVLTDKQCQMWYPGNTETLEYNRGLRNIMAQVPTTRGAPSEGDVMRGMKGGERKTKGDMLLSAPSAAVVSSASFNMADSSRVSKEQGYVGDELVRSASYTQPRSITLDTKYQGAPQVEVWTGYGVLVINKDGERRFVQGPSTILLEYDETFEILEMSTGKPKNTDNLLKTVFLRTENNQVTDIIRAETSDHVVVETKLSYWVNFEAEPLKWFSVENYVKYLCDHVRSVLKGFIKKSSIKEFYANSTDLLRNWVLGADHKGMEFGANGMRLTDVEVLTVAIADPTIRTLLDQSQTEVVKTDIELAALTRQLDVTREREHIAQEEAETKAETTKLRLTLETELAAASLAVTLAKLANQLQAAEKEKETKAAAEAVIDFTHDANMAREKKRNDQNLAFQKLTQDLEVARLKAEAETTVQRFQAAVGGFSEALLAISNNETMVKVSEAWGIQRIIGGENVSDALAKVFAGSPLAPLMERIAHGVVPSNGTDKKLVEAAKS